MFKVIQFIAVACTAMLGASPSNATSTPSPWLLRVGVAWVSPTEKTPQPAGTIEFDDGEGLTAGAAYTLSPQWRVALDLIAPHSHDIEFNGTKVASADFLPVMLSVQYRLTRFERVQPYVGLGGMVTLFSDEQLGAGIPGGDLELDSSVGIAATLGVDWLISERFLLNADVRAWKSDSDASLGGSDVGTFDIDPIAVGIGVGYLF